MFADDVVLCSETREEVEGEIENWRKALEDRGMRVNQKKTEYLCAGGGEAEPGDVRMQGEVVPRVQDFKYLGSTVQDDCGANREVTKRIAADWMSWKKVTGVVCDKKVPSKVKGKIYKVVVRPALLYGMETVAMTKRLEKKLEVAEMKMLRWMKGVTRKDRERNVDVRKELQVRELSDKLREGRLRWYGHVRRRENNYVGNRVMRMNTGRRKRGRSKRR